MFKEVKELSHKWTDLYTHGERLNWLCKRFYTEFKKAEEDNNENLMIIYGEALRKVTMNCVDVAKTVLGVEEIVNGKAI